jgi:hypothetical protein
MRLTTRLLNMRIRQPLACQRRITHVYFLHIFHRFRIQTGYVSANCFSPDLPAVSPLSCMLASPGTSV